MNDQNIKKFHHQVPRSYLARFSSNRKQLCCFNFKNGKSFTSNVNRLGGERFFYRVEEKFSSDPNPFHIEDKLGQLEGSYPALFDRLISKPQINDQDRESLSRFLALQFVRTRPHREMLRKSTEELVEEFRSTGQDILPKYGFTGMELADTIESLGVQKFSDAASIETLVNNPFFDCIVQHWASYSFVVGKAPNPYDVWTSDNPIVLAFDVFRANGATGLLSPFILILFPLDHQHFLFVSSEPLGPDSVRRGLLDLPQVLVDHYNVAQAATCYRQVYWNIEDDMPIAKLERLQEHLADPTPMYWGKEKNTGFPVFARDLFSCLDAAVKGLPQLENS
jgi:hypothetical protein